MGRIEKTVFISYRRTNAPWALAIFQNLTQHGYDVFFDFDGIPSGDFERVILQNIAARAHFLVLLTPSALERCSEPADLFRLEIESALRQERNIIPVMLEGFAFNTPSIERELVGPLALLKRYNAIGIPTEYFLEAMSRLRDRFLNVPLDAVLHPVSADAQQATIDQKTAASEATLVTHDELTAQQWFERAVSSSNVADKIQLYSEAIRLDPNFAVAFNNRAVERESNNDVTGAMQDLNEAIRLDPTLFNAFYNRGNAYLKMGSFVAAATDFTEAVRLKPNFAAAFNMRGVCRYRSGDFIGATVDFDEALRLDPALKDAAENRAMAVQNIKGNANNLRYGVAGFFSGFRQGLRTGGKKTNKLHRRKKRTAVSPTAVQVLSLNYAEKPYFGTLLQAAFGTLSTVLSAGMFFLSHTLARHRPKNGATATIANAIPKTTRICSPLPDSLTALPSRGVQVD